MNWDVFLNIAPIIIIIYAISLWLYLKNDSIFASFVMCIVYIYFGLFYSHSIDGYGNIYVVIISQVVYFIVFTFAIIVEWDEDGWIFRTILIYLEIMILVCIYLRLKSEEILEIKFIDELFKKILEADFMEFINNDWIKGILIAAIGGVVAGLVLNKLSKKK